MMNLFYLALVVCIIQITNVSAFAPTRSNVMRHTSTQQYHIINNILLQAAGDNDNLGVIDLTDEDEDEAVAVSTPPPQQQSPAAPFLSQGELSDDPNLLNPDFNDAKQSRVIFYIILTLVPIVSFIYSIYVSFIYCLSNAHDMYCNSLELSQLFLVPLMLGSRDLIPLDALPPVEMSQ